jgi:hypothetical protein
MEQLDHTRGALYAHVGDASEAVICRASTCGGHARPSENALENRTTETGVAYGIESGSAPCADHGRCAHPTRVAHEGARGTLSDGSRASPHRTP